MELQHELSWSHLISHHMFSCSSSIIYAVCVMCSAGSTSLCCQFLGSCCFAARLKPNFATWLEQFDGDHIMLQYWVKVTNWEACRRILKCRDIFVMNLMEKGWD